MRRTACLAVLAASLAAATPAVAAPRITVSPNPVDHDEIQTTRAAAGR